LFFPHDYYDTLDDMIHFKRVSIVRAFLVSAVNMFSYCVFFFFKNNNHPHSLIRQKAAVYNKE